MDNGPIVIVPGSHRAIFRPPKDTPAEFPDELWVLAKPGQAVLFSGWLYHRGRGQQLGCEAPGVPDVLPERVDEVARDLRRAEG